jgi:hypothetical protein
MATFDITLSTFKDGAGTGELRVGLPIDPPYDPDLVLTREAGRVRDAFKDLWVNHYGSDPAHWPPMDRAGAPAAPALAGRGDAAHGVWDAGVPQGAYRPARHYPPARLTAPSHPRS